METTTLLGISLSIAETFSAYVSFCPDGQMNQVLPAFQKEMKKGFVVWF